MIWRLLIYIQNNEQLPLPSGILICFIVSINIFGGIPTTPDDLLSFVAFMFLANIPGVTVKRTKF